MGVALVAVVLISVPARVSTLDEKRQRQIDLGSLTLVVGAGLGFAGFFVFLAQATTSGETWWPLVVVRGSGLVVALLAFVVAIARARQPSLATRADWLLGLPKLRVRALPRSTLAALLVLTRLGDLGGNAFFILARHADAVAVAVILSSLYPVITTLLAAVFLHERLRRVQLLGVVLASLSVPLLR
jgi:glucose uptake protein GlcU